MEADLVALYRQVIEDKELSFDQKLTLLDEVRKIAPPDQHRYNFRYAIWALAGIAISIPILSFTSFNISPGLLSLGSTAVGALAAYMAPATRRRQEPALNIAAPQRQQFH